MSQSERQKSQRSSCGGINRTQLKYNEQKSLKIISRKRAKVLQYSSVEKSKIDLYWKLANKLEKELKEIKSHNTPEARQKLLLLQKCRSQRHIRRKTRKLESSQFGPSYLNNQQKILIRPKTCCPKTLKYSFHKNAYQKADGKENCFQLTNLKIFCNRLDEIRLQCVRQESRSQQIKQDINTVYFYQRLISKNSSKIFTKML